MDIFETIRESIETVGQITTDLAKKTAETIRLKDQISKDKKRIRRLTYEIGQTYLRLHEEDYEDVYKDFVDGIKAARADIEEKEVALAALKEQSETPEAKDIKAADENKEWDDFFKEISEAEEAREEAAAEEASESSIEIVEAQREPEEAGAQTVPEETAAETVPEEAGAQTVQS